MGHFACLSHWADEWLLRCEDGNSLPGYPAKSQLKIGPNWADLNKWLIAHCNIEHLGRLTKAITDLWDKKQTNVLY